MSGIKKKKKKVNCKIFDFFKNQFILHLKRMQSAKQVSENKTVTKEANQIIPSFDLYSSMNFDGKIEIDFNGFEDILMKNDKPRLQLKLPRLFLKTKRSSKPFFVSDKFKISEN